MSILFILLIVVLLVGATAVVLARPVDENGASEPVLTSTPAPVAPALEPYPMGTAVPPDPYPVEIHKNGDFNSASIPIDNEIGDTIGGNH